jgi:hypothetical protein
MARARLRRTVAELESNDDELRKDVAARANEDGGYPLDVV